MLPPSVYIGRKVSFIGKLRTFDGGERAQVTDAIPFQAKFWSVMDPMLTYLWQYLDDPREWVEEGLLDKYRIKDIA